LEGLLFGLHLRILKQPVASSELRLTGEPHVLTSLAETSRRTFVRAFVVECVARVDARGLVHRRSCLDLRTDERLEAAVGLEKEARLPGREGGGEAR
jgi:hypothetical protein